ncbi:uncharacterized protein YlzI (FlbEa/FlbD family) [Chryseobacterium sp. SORGH_AS 447]|uniref:hypothetical protein n=1 Tax=Chryseobacterium sp. SORGH_AS_0447 TaxID=3041769 RepID=UPI00278AFA7B|nr:hypothetical protein [Chryseobacterium sp. SORGH_AS_0447]MDQ1160256.1 uncharacterized protein YlzI (FlbEa/FlbD family) [Chryseobacterium sp. SORGH_AS_0447]
MANFIELIDIDGNKYHVNPSNISHCHEQKLLDNDGKVLLNIFMGNGKLITIKKTLSEFKKLLEHTS